jgi:hypothetical protein
MAGQMKLLSIVGRLTWLTIFVAGSVYAQNTVPTDNTKGAPPEAKQDNKPLQERPDTIPDDKKRDPGTTDTAHPELGGDITRPLNRDDVVREILTNRPSDKHTPVPPR